MCVFQNKSIQGCTPKSTGCKSFADQVLFICVLQNESTQGGLQRLRVTKVWPTHCCCEHTHMCVAGEVNAELDRGSRVARVWPARCCCEHTHACCRKIHVRVGLADHVLLQTHMCAAHPRVEVLQTFGRPRAAASLHIE